VNPQLNLCSFARNWSGVNYTSQFIITQLVILIEAIYINIGNNNKIIHAMIHNVIDVLLIRNL